jgi:hypothetical protein
MSGHWKSASQNMDGPKSIFFFSNFLWWHFPILVMCKIGASRLVCWQFTQLHLVTRLFYSETHWQGFCTTLCMVILAVMLWRLSLFVVWCPALYMCVCRSIIWVSVMPWGFICLQEYIGTNNHRSWCSSKCVRACRCARPHTHPRVHTDSLPW